MTSPENNPYLFSVVAGAAFPKFFDFASMVMARTKAPPLPQSGAEAFADEKRRIRDLHDAEAGFRDEKKAIIVALNTQHRQKSKSGKSGKKDKKRSKKSRPGAYQVNTKAPANDELLSPDSLESFNDEKRRIRSHRDEETGLGKERNTIIAELATPVDQPNRTEEKRRIPSSPNARPGAYQSRVRVSSRQNPRQPSESMPAMQPPRPLEPPMYGLEAPVDQPARRGVSADYIEEERRKVRKYTLWALVACFVLAVIGAGVGIGIGLLGGSSGSQDDEVDDFCNARSIVLECQNRGYNGRLSANAISKGCAKRYNALRTLWISNVYPDFAHDGTCHPSNLALFELADGDDLYNHTQLLNRYVLSTLYFQLNGKSWPSKDDWLQDGDECEWQGVRCDNVTKEVTAIELNENDLLGAFPSELALLTSLCEFPYLVSPFLYVCLCVWTQLN